jgi:hypothetical protein
MIWRVGVSLGLDHATLGNWAGRARFHFKPVTSYMRRHLAGADGLFMDETTVPVLDTGRSNVKKGFFWGVPKTVGPTAESAVQMIQSAATLRDNRPRDL